MARDLNLPTRRPRASRRRPDVSLPTGERIPPRSGLSRAEVRENQRGRIFDGLAAALSYHGYEDTKITDVVELSGVSRATFYEHFQGKEACFAAAYEDGIERLAVAIRAAAANEDGWAARVSAGLSAGLEFLASGPALAQLLLIEALAATRPARLEYEHSLERLAEVLSPPVAEVQGGEPVPRETARLLAGGLASHLSGRVLAGEADALPEDHALLLGYLLAPFQAAMSLAADRRSVGRA